MGSHGPLAEAGLSHSSTHLLDPCCLLHVLSFHQPGREIPEVTCTWHPDACMGSSLLQHSNCLRGPTVAACSVCARVVCDGLNILVFL